MLEKTKPFKTQILGMKSRGKIIILGFWINKNDNIILDHPNYIHYLRYMIMYTERVNQKQLILPIEKKTLLRKHICLLKWVV